MNGRMNILMNEWMNEYLIVNSKFAAFQRWKAVLAIHGCVNQQKSRLF